MTVQAALRAFQLDADLRRHVHELQRLNEQLELTVAQRTAELVEKNRELETLAVTDRLTRLYNRLFLDRVLAREFAAVERSGRGFALILLDIDKFKQVNDSFGHHAGDAVLVALAEILRERVRGSDVAGRWGGEEFLVICPDTDLSGAAQAAETLRGRIEGFAFHHVGQCTASFGVAAYLPGDTSACVVERADQALYAAKAGGRNRVKLSEQSARAHSFEQACPTAADMDGSGDPLAQTQQGTMSDTSILCLDDGGTVLSARLAVFDGSEHKD